MEQYTFVIEATISMHVDVKANSLAEAVEKAQGASVMSMCHQCARGETGEWNTSGELDCDPAGSPIVAACCGDNDIDLEEVRKFWQ
jgi:hypothetical protein